MAPSDVQMVIGSKVYTLAQFTTKVGSFTSMPIWKGYNFRLADGAFGVSIPLERADEKRDFMIGYTIYAPKMETKTVFRNIHQTKRRLTY
jgi:hypothetical protein